ncbi:hypothetical protein WA1_06030 [Scytonema hofmannii PCC 7110]|uniref:Uncharacterized protein n=1 Tax=Scytonema hofmannii PCC 7110 TaxID=128403 RepID=A0A139WSH1_9CYAN|nr:caspase family protein [Scytonema hofmannii]KYC35382.1 hypothetical protein WA1_06030 [Scytonema hofmannii PCC 7110]
MNQIKRSYAIVVGINSYTNDIPPLETAVNDAKRFAEILKQSHQYQVLELLDTDATQGKLKNLIENLKQGKLPLGTKTITIEENDRLLFYFAGHGIVRDGLEFEDGQAAGYLLPQDAHKHENSFLPMQLLHDTLVGLDCHHLLVILDCCFAGAFRWSSSTREAMHHPKMYRERYDRYIRGYAQQVITSAAHDEKAVDVLSCLGDKPGKACAKSNRGVGSTGKHSPFAEILFEALENGKGDVIKDGVMTASELYVYLHNELGKKIHQQTPSLCHLKKHDKGEFIFLVPGFDPKNLEKALPLDENTNPYRGLNSYEFNEEDSKLFFGRDQAIKNLKAQILESEDLPLTVVLGASGTGKSSLVKAGLLPALSKEQWHILSPMRPDSSPFAALASTLINQSTLFHSYSIRSLSKQLRQPQKVIESFKNWSRNNSVKLLLVIDQFEELVTMCQPEEKKQFLDLLKALLTECSEHLKILIALRSDFEHHFSNELLSSNRWMAARFIVQPMKREELREVIEKPAAEKVLYFDPPQLVNQLLDDVAQMPGALPLLSFTLSELYLKYLHRRGCDRALRQKDYEDLGGAIGSLTKRATQECEQLIVKDSAYKKTVRQVMLRMVAREGGESARRRVPLSELKYPDADENKRVEEFLNRFSQARLIIGDKNFEGKPYFEPAHDALVRVWDKLQTWIAQEQNTLIWQQRLTPTVNDWLNHDDKEQTKGFLWTDSHRLKYLEKLLQSEDNWLNQVETEFVKQSIQQRNDELERAKQQLEKARQAEISALVALSEARVQQIKRSLLAQAVPGLSPWLKEGVVTRTEVMWFIMSASVTMVRRCS